MYLLLETRNLQASSSTKKDGGGIELGSFIAVFEKTYLKVYAWDRQRLSPISDLPRNEDAEEWQQEFTKR